MIDYFFNPEFVEALGWTLLHSVWQGAAFAIFLMLILIALRSYTAQSRYIVAVGILCAFFLTVTVTFWQQWKAVNHASELKLQLTHEASSNGNILLESPSEITLSSDNKEKITASLNHELKAENQSGWIVVFKNYYQRHLPLLVTIWFLGVLFLQLRFLGQLAYVQRIKHYGTQLFPEVWKGKIEELEGKLRIQKKVKYLTSLRIESPMVIGWLKPAVLVPRQIFNSLSESEIYAVLAHELAHIRREDFMVNLLQTFLCNIFFFHPGVWSMSNRVDDEREHCCDDLAVAATGPATSYAKTLINVSELKLRMQENPSLAMALAGKNKKRARGGFTGRIHRLFIGGNSTGTFKEGFATACILIAASFLGVIATGNTGNSDNLNKVTVIDKIELQEEKKEKITTTITTTESIFDKDKLPIAKPVTPIKPTAPAKTLAPPLISDDTRIDALVMACAEGDFEFVKTLINSGIDINGIGSEGFTPLMMAASNDKTKIIAYLLEKGAEVNQKNNGWTALIEAADEGSLPSMKLLLEAGAEVNYYWGQDTPTAITMAASEGKLKCLKLLLEYGADINGIGKSLPPIHIAVAEDKRSIIDYLISQKINIDEKDSEGRTALMYAASEGKNYGVKKLLKAGADKSVLDFNGLTARDHADRQEEYHTRDYLGMPEKSEIHKKTLKGQIKEVQKMVETGADINKQDNYGRTPLHLAAAENHTVDIRALVDLGADLNIQDHQGKTPLMYAAANGKRDAAILLVSFQADWNIKDKEGYTAHDWSRTGGNLSLIRFFGLITKKNNHSYEHNHTDEEKETGQKKDQKKRNKRESFHSSKNSSHLKQYDLGNKTPRLFDVVRNGSELECRQLIVEEKSINDTDETGQTALMIAASTNQVEMAKLLIEHGADVNKSSASGLTALHYAALENYAEMAKLLLKNNANVDPTMQYSSTDGNYTEELLVCEYIGATPLLIAIESKNLEVVILLLKAGANKYHTLTKNEYRLNKSRENYLTVSEVMGIDKDFLKEVKLKISDNTWTPYKQALASKEPTLISFLN